MKRIRSCVVATVVLLCGGWAPTTVNAQAAYPERQIRIVVPSPAGGPSDVIARLVGKKMADEWGHPVVIDNRPGANGIIGTELVAKAAPDGYTLILSVDSTMTMHQHTYKRLPYDPMKDFIHISIIANSVVVLLANENLPIRSFADFLKVSAARPGQINVGVGTMTTHVIMEQLSSIAGAKVVKVPYKGSSEIPGALLGKHIDMALAGVTPFLNAMESGKLLAIASTGTKRAAATPQVPTFAELGYPGFDTGVWLGLAAPAGTPAPIISKISAEITKILNSKDVIDRFAALGLEPMPGDPASTLALIRAQSEAWGKVIKEAGITSD
jgi:tripartite-type tricarboxylate transporter receptor subunit TctC